MIPGKPFVRFFQVSLILALSVSSASLVLTSPAHAGDMRKAYADLAKKREDMAAKATNELSQAQAEARENAMAIKKDKSALMAAIAEFKSKNARLDKDNSDLKVKIDTLADEQGKLKESLEESRMVNKELAGFVRTYAKDLSSLLAQSPQSAFDKDRNAFLRPVINRKRFWSMDDLRQMTDTLFDEIMASGQVTVRQGNVVDRQGKDRTARILSIGNFTSVYMLGDKAGNPSETGFLLYSDQSSRFFALSRLPSPELEKQLAAYLSGNSDTVPVDISKGGALRRFTHELNLIDQVPKGGPLVWPIVALLGLALIILLERLFFFLRHSLRMAPFMVQLAALVEKENWQGCRNLMEKNKKGFVPGVLLKALPFKAHTRTDMENALQEAILAQIPSIERFLSTLGMLAAIAPLMGLLGTVTGMINTFHVITYYGTGDPRMMSGGISEALVTTMLGLTVAIPIMLFHTLLSRKVETQISNMEEKSVAFINMVFKARNDCHPNPVMTGSDSADQD